MKRLLIAAMLMSAGMLFAQSAPGTYNNVMPSYAADPANCGLGQIYFNTASTIFKGCNSVGTWGSFGQVGVAQTWTAAQTFNGAVTFANTISTSGGFTGNTLFIEGAGPTGSAGNDSCGGNSTTHTLQCNFNNGTTFSMTQTIGSGTAIMTTAAIGAGACGTTVTVVAASVATTDTITWAFNAAPAGTNAGIVAWPTAGNVNFAYCPGVAETPAAATINWRVVR